MRTARPPLMTRLRLQTFSLSLAGALAFASCGGGDDDDDGKDASSPVDNFVGTWTIASGMVTPMCGMLPVPPRPLAGSMITATKGEDGTLTIGVQLEGQTCSLKYEVSGDTATARPMQSCMVTVSMIAATLNVSAATFKVSGTSGTLDMMGSATTAIGIACTLTLNGTANKGAAQNTDGGARAGDAGVPYMP